MLIKGYSTFPQSSSVQFSVIPKTLIGGILYLCRHAYSSAPDDIAASQTVGLEVLSFSTKPQSLSNEDLRTLLQMHFSHLCALKFHPLINLFTIFFLLTSHLIKFPISSTSVISFSSFSTFSLSHICDGLVNQIRFSFSWNCTLTMATRDKTHHCFSYQVSQYINIEGIKRSVKTKALI